MLKGSILRNCKWVVGIVIYTGMKTKIMLNSNKPTIKFSKIDNILEIKRIFAVQENAVLYSTIFEQLVKIKNQIHGRIN